MVYQREINDVASLKEEQGGMDEVATTARVSPPFRKSGITISANTMKSTQGRQ